MIFLLSTRALVEVQVPAAHHQHVGAVRVHVRDREPQPDHHRGRRRGHRALHGERR